MNRPLASITALVFVTLAGQSLAQSRQSSAIIGASNTNILGEISSETVGGTAPVSTSVVRSFTGLNSSGGEQTMTLDATAWAQADYGRLRARASGTLTNAYENDANVPFYDDAGNLNEDGSPTRFATIAYAEFTDTVTAVGGVRAGYKNRYTFFVDGTVTGSSLAAYIQFTAGSNPREFLNIDLSSGGSQIAQYLTTSAYPVTATARQDFNVLLSAQFNPETFGEPSLVEGSADFSSTVTLTGIGTYDENDNLVSSVSYIGDSGTVYAPVPEPASLATLGLGLLAARRRRKSATA